MRNRVRAYVCGGLQRWIWRSASIVSAPSNASAGLGVSLAGDFSMIACTPVAPNARPTGRACPSHTVRAAGSLPKGE